MAQPNKKMLAGLNHNLNYRGRTYHVQTEDSGRQNPNLVTHLFAGGAVLATKKVSYSNLLSEPDVERRVQGLMEEQHKAMLRDLVEGGFDHIDPNPATTSSQPGPAAEDLPEALIDGKTLDELIASHLDAQIGK